jgi:hypothetical protein
LPDHTRLCKSLIDKKVDIKAILIKIPWKVGLLKVIIKAIFLKS